MGTRLSLAKILSKVTDWEFEDIYAEGLIMLMEHIKQGRLNEENCTNLSGYVYMICKHIALKKYHQAQKNCPYDQTAFMQKASDKSFDPDEMAQDDEMVKEFLDRVFSEMPDKCRGLLKRFYWERMSMDEIAPLLGLRNADATKTTKNRCMNKFKELAKMMLENDERAEIAVQRTVERESLRGLLEQFRQESEGKIVAAACRKREDKS